MGRAVEEMLGQVTNARLLFERWLAFNPYHHGYRMCIKWHRICIKSKQGFFYFSKKLEIF